MPFQIVGILKVFVAKIADEGFARGIGLDLDGLDGLMVGGLDGLELRLSLDLRASGQNGGGAAQSAGEQRRGLSGAVEERPRQRQDLLLDRRLVRRV